MVKTPCFVAFEIIGLEGARAHVHVELLALKRPCECLPGTGAGKAGNRGREKSTIVRKRWNTPDLFQCHHHVFSTVSLWRASPAAAHVPRNPDEWGKKSLLRNYFSFVSQSFSFFFLRAFRTKKSVAVTSCLQQLGRFPLVWRSDRYSFPHIYWLLIY